MTATTMLPEAYGLRPSWTTGNPEFDAFLATLKVGERCNVRRAWPGDPPVMRIITSIELIQRDSEQWIYWRWKPESHMPDGYPDCGYSGHRIA